MDEYHKMSQNDKTYGSCVNDDNEEWIGYGYRDGDLDRTEGQNSVVFEDEGITASAKKFMGASIGDFGASLSISMRAKPSYDRKASAPLACRKIIFDN